MDYRDHHLHPTVNSLSAEEWYESYGSIYKNMIDQGLLTKERLDDAVRRVLALKQWIGQRKETVPEVAIEKWQKECADKSVTLVKNKENVIPLSADKILEAEIILLGNPKCPDGDIGEITRKLLEKRGF